MQRTFPKAKSQAAYSILRRDSNRNKHPAIKWGGRRYSRLRTQIYDYYTVSSTILGPELDCRSV
jgi:hypothetical protein